MEKRFLEIKVIIGLGNPDRGYKNTYHNAGKLFAGYLAETAGTESRGFRVSPSGLFETRKIEKIVLIKPLNFMNENGRAAKLALKSAGAKPENLLVVHDDSDLEVGKYKISFGRGSAGHRGAQSVIENLGTKNFWRLRIGIRPIRPIGPARLKANDFVLKKIAPTDKKTLDSVFKKAAGELFGADCTL